MTIAGGRRVSRGAKRTPAVYEVLKRSYAVHGLNHAQAAREADVSKQLAILAFESGWPEYEWAAPIRVVLENEGVLVRARMGLTDKAVQVLLNQPEVVGQLRGEIKEHAYKEALKQIEEEKLEGQRVKERAKLAAVKVREEEAELAGAIRSRGRAVIKSLASPLPELLKFGETLNRRLKLINDTKTEDLLSLEPLYLLKIMRSYAEVLQQSTAIIMAAQVIDRKAAGDPDFVLEQRGPEMSYEEALRVIQQAGAMSLQGASFTPQKLPSR